MSKTETPVTDEITITTPFYWSRIGVAGAREKGLRINQGRGFVFVADDEILPLANALADHLAATNHNN